MKGGDLPLGRDVRAIVIYRREHQGSEGEVT